MSASLKSCENGAPAKARSARPKQESASRQAKAAAAIVAAMPSRRRLAARTDDSRRRAAQPIEPPASRGRRSRADR